MKNLILGSLSIVLLSSFATPALSSEELAVVTVNGSQTTTNYLPPVTLVQLAYQGYFTDLGIPSHGGFKSALISKQVTAETLIRSAIAKGSLSENVFKDKNYLDVLDTQLEGVIFD
jgi:hypothetical protein